MTSKKLYLTDAIKEFNKKFEKGKINLLISHAGSGKTHFIFKEFLSNSNDYVDYLTPPYSTKLNKVLYVCDTTMLKDSVLAEYSEITEALKKGGLIDAKRDTDFYSLINGEDYGTIKVISYSTFGLLLQSEANKHLINKYFEVIIMDEFHQLFDYCKKYNINKNGVFVDGNYTRAIDNLKELSENTLIISLTATKDYIDNFKEKVEFDFGTIKEIFQEEELKKIRRYNFEPIYTNSLTNVIKTTNWTVAKEHGFKTLIYTRTVRQAELYKQYLISVGANAEWICSTNRNELVEYIEEETGAIVKESVPVMSGYKKEIRDRLLYGIDENRLLAGTLPSELDVLIINGAYETGWNLTDDRVQIVMIDSLIPTVQIQARNRCRHDIKVLWCVTKDYNEEGRLIVKNHRGELVESDIDVYTGKIEKLDSKYIGVKLSKKMRDEIIYRYGLKGINDREINWETVKRDLIGAGYVVESYKGKNSGTYIYKEGQKVKKDSRKAVKKLDKLKEFLEENDGQFIDEKEINRFIKIVNIIKADGTLQDKPKKINEHLSSIELNYTILNKPSNGKRRWKIESYN